MPNKLTCWATILKAERELMDDTDGPAVLSDFESFHLAFDSGHGSATSVPAVRAWTEKRVYFSVRGQGASWLDSVPRFPDEEENFRHIES